MTDYALLGYELARLFDRCGDEGLDYMLSRWGFLATRPGFEYRYDFSGCPFVADMIRRCHDYLLERLAQVPR